MPHSTPIRSDRIDPTRALGLDRRVRYKEVNGTLRRIYIALISWYLACKHSLLREPELSILDGHDAKQFLHERSSMGCFHLASTANKVIEAKGVRYPTTESYWENSGTLESFSVVTCVVSLGSVYASVLVCMFCYSLLLKTGSSKNMSNRPLNLSFSKNDMAKPFGNLP